jgi:hypothetical protein
MARRSDWDVFLNKYKPIEHYKENGFYMYETYGKEYEIVQKHIKNYGENYIWTLIDGSSSKMYAIPGWHFINRLGYLLTTIPFKEGETRDYLY